MSVAGFCFFDEKGKELYFDEDPTKSDFTFQDAFEIKLANPTWVIKTDDIGYFYRAFVEKEVNPYWENYDVLLFIGIVSGITGTLWITSGVVNINKAYFCRWDLTFKGILITAVAFALFIGGNVPIILRIREILNH